MSVVIGSPSRAPARRPWRRLSRGGGALLASLAAHALAAVTVGGVLARGTPTAAHPAALVELELAPAEPAGGAPLAAAPAPVAPPAPPVRAHPAPRRRVAVPAPSVARAAEPAPTPAAAAVPTRETTPPFVMSASMVAAHAAVKSSAGRVAPSSGSPDEAGVGVAGAFGEGDVNQPARLVTPSPLIYPAAARAAEIELDFPVEIIVDTVGRVVEARPLRRAGYGLDDAAMRAIRAYRFAPAMRAGRAVPVRMRWTVQFRLR